MSAERSSVVEATCQKIVRGDWSSHRCGRPIKSDGLCGIHLAAENRKLANEQKRQEEKQRDDAIRAEAEVIGQKLGIAVTADYTYSGSCTGDFVVPGEWLRSKAAE